MAQFEDLTGRTFGRLEVLRPISRNTRNRIIWECLCKCGSIVRRVSANLKKREINSCGKKLCKNHFPGNALPATATIIYHQYLNNAKKHNRDFQLTKEDFKELIYQNCHYCGCEPLNEFRKVKGHYTKYNGLDRIDNSIGYIRSNVVPCCFICNRAKGPFDTITWNSWLDRIKKFQNDR